MKAAVLVKEGSPQEAFEVQDLPTPSIGQDEVLIQVEGFGLNFADVMARLGIYPDRPPLPAVIGYDVVGYVIEVGEKATSIEVGDRVTALTRFGGYAEFAKANHLAVSKISKDLPLGAGLALATQYCTAYFSALDVTNIHEGDQVLVHAAAGGVGTALVQLAKMRKCTVFGTASPHKLQHCRDIGVDYPIDYRNTDFAVEVRSILNNRGLDVIFDPVGGKTTRKGIQLLGSGGRMVVFGASSMTGAKNIVSKLGVAAGFGVYHPVYLMSNSKSILGVNMLRIGDDRPLTFKRVLDAVVRLASDGSIRPVYGKEYSFDELGKAHDDLESRRSIGKLAVRMI